MRSAIFPVSRGRQAIDTEWGITTDYPAAITLFLTGSAIISFITGSVFARGLVTFGKSKLVIISKSGRHSFDVELALSTSASPRPNVQEIFAVQCRDAV